MCDKQKQDALDSALADLEDVKNQYDMEISILMGMDVSDAEKHGLPSITSSFGGPGDDARGIPTNGGTYYRIELEGAELTIQPDKKGLESFILFANKSEQREDLVIVSAETLNRKAYAMERLSRLIGKEETKKVLSERADAIEFVKGRLAQRLIHLESAGGEYNRRLLGNFDQAEAGCPRGNYK